MYLARYFTFLSAVAIFATLSLSEGLARNACFERTYDAQHLAGHPGQSVRTMRLTIGPPAFDIDEAGGDLSITLRNGQRFDASIACRRPTGNTQACGIECDGGRFSLSYRSSDQSVLLRTGTPELFFAACGSVAFELKRDPEHRAFRLFRCD
ncbi:MAG: hypothetical protein AAGE89_13195 [Pseudomonadota bacterium]